MKNIVFLLTIIGLLSCSPKTLPNAETTFIKGGETGTISLRFTGYYKGGKSPHDEVFEAEKNAFETLFFRGIPGSQIASPMIKTSEGETKSKHKKYFDSFYNDKRYRTFIVSSDVVSKGTDKGFKKAVVVLKINYKTLRKDLESNSVLRKFGI